MESVQLSDKISKLLRKREFISIASCDFSGRPNVAPKFFLKMEKDFIHLADYVRGTTFNNLKLNPRVSLSVMDLDNLVGYQLNGGAEIISEGKNYQDLLSEFRAKEISLSSQRIIEGLDRGKTHAAFEVALSEQVVFFKIKIEECVEISPAGELKREKL